jgi:outer membrane protein TolC
MIFLTGLALTGRARPQLPPSPADDVPEETDLLRAAAGRPERRAAQQSVAAAEQDERAARGASRPDVFALARVEEGNPNGLFFPPEEQWQADAFVGVALSWNLFDSGLARSRTQAAATRAEQARLRLTELDDLLALDARDSRSALLDALDRVRFAGRVLESARRNLATATDLWRNGLARHADVLDAHSQLTDAEYQVSSARADAALARGGLARAAGRMPPVSAAPAEPTP